MTTFIDLPIHSLLQESLVKMGYETMTPIQEQTIPVALESKDILGSAPTGTGKTAAFGIPLINNLLENPHKQALILSPTRELAQQIHQVLRTMTPQQTPLRSALLIGGEPMRPQFEILRRRPRLIIGTPGRVKDHLDRQSLDLSLCQFLVLDEADRMLHMGFEEQLLTIREALSETRQTLLFSATMSPQIMRLSKNYLNDPVRIAVGSANAASINVKQDVLHTTPSQKYQDLLSALEERTGSVIVFVKTKRGADKLTDMLADENHSVLSIHGDHPQHVRRRVIQNFRSGHNRILVATDVAARGLDMPVDHVINFDPPQCPEDYIHRIGRTGRAGAEGAALSLLVPADRMIWRAIERLKNPDSSPMDRPMDGFGPSNQNRRSGPPRRYNNSRPRHERAEGGYRSEGSSHHRPAQRNSAPGRSADHGRRRSNASGRPQGAYAGR